MARATALALLLTVATTGCRSIALPDRLPDLYTQRHRIPVWVEHTSLSIDQISRATWYLDIAETLLRAQLWMAPEISGVALHSPGLRLRGSLVGGWATVGRPDLGLAVVVRPGNQGPASYVHERLHQVGHRHPRGGWWGSHQQNLLKLEQGISELAQKRCYGGY